MDLLNTHFIEEINNNIKHLTFTIGEEYSNLKEDITLVVKKNTFEYDAFSHDGFKIDVLQMFNQECAIYVRNKIKYIENYRKDKNYGVIYFIGEETFIQYKRNKEGNIFTKDIIDIDSKKCFIHYLRIYDVITKYISNSKGFELKFQYESTEDRDKSYGCGLIRVYNIYSNSFIYNLINIKINEYCNNMTIMILDSENNYLLIKSYHKYLIGYYLELYLKIKYIFNNMKSLLEEEYGDNSNLKKYVYNVRWRRKYISIILEYMHEIGLLKERGDKKLIMEEYYDMNEEDAMETRRNNTRNIITYYESILDILFPYPISSLYAGVCFYKELKEYGDIVNLEVLDRIRNYTDEIYVTID